MTPTERLRFSPPWWVGILLLAVLLLLGSWLLRAKWRSGGRGTGGPGAVSAARDPSNSQTGPLQPDDTPPDVGDSARKFADYQRGITGAATLEQQARTLARSVVNSCKGYYAEYSIYPLHPDGTAGEVRPRRTDEILTGILLGMQVEQNPKKISFLPEVKPVERGGGAGLFTEGEANTLVDPWGEQYYVLMDTDHSASIDNPDAASPVTQLYQGVIIWSAGPDKDPSTWKDNVMSWDIGVPDSRPTRARVRPD